MYQAPSAPSAALRQRPAVASKGLKPDQDYPLVAFKRPELIKSPTGKTLSDITGKSIKRGCKGQGCKYRS